AVNATFAVVAPFLCHRDEEAALALAIEGFDFLRYSGLHSFVAGEHAPGVTDLWRAFAAEQTRPGAQRSLFVSTAPLAGPDAKRAGIESHRGAVGTPAQLHQLPRAYPPAGGDQGMFPCQGGRLPPPPISPPLRP